MIGLDTNIVIRYVTQDDPAQSTRAGEILEHELTPDNPGFVSLVVMAEIAWVLGRAYRFDAAAIAAVVERMLHTDTLVVDSEPEVFAAMTALKTGAASFTDALIAALGRTAGCTHTLTFDRRALRLPGFAPAMSAPH